MIKGGDPLTSLSLSQNADKECTKKTFLLEFKSCSSSHDGATKYKTGSEDMEADIAKLCIPEARQAARQVLSEAPGSALATLAPE